MIKPIVGTVMRKATAIYIATGRLNWQTPSRMRMANSKNYKNVPTLRFNTFIFVNMYSKNN